MFRKPHILLLFFVTLFCATTGNAQDQTEKDNRHERIQAARVSFLSDKMQLTPDQAQKFWPVYNEYHNKRKQLKQSARVFKNQDLDAMTDAQLREGITQMMDYKQKEAELEKSYVDRFLATISPKQLALMYRGEKEFMQMLIRRLDDKHHAAPAGKEKN